MVDYKYVKIFKHAKYELNVLSHLKYELSNKYSKDIV